MFPVNPPFTEDFPASHVDYQRVHGSVSLLSAIDFRLESPKCITFLESRKPSQLNYKPAGQKQTLNLYLNVT